VIIGESLRLDPPLRGVKLVVSGITRFPAPDEPAAGPPWWTFIEFEAEQADGDRLAALLADTLDDALPWYASFQSATEMYVVFARRVFRYPSVWPSAVKRWRPTPAASGSPSRSSTGSNSAQSLGRTSLS